MEKISKIYKKIEDKEEAKFISNYKFGEFTINGWLELIEKTPPNDPKINYYFDKVHNGVIISMIHFILKKYVDEKSKKTEKVGVA